MSEGLAKPEQELITGREIEQAIADLLDEKSIRERRLARIRVFWLRRRFLARIAACGLVVSAVTAFLIPARYVSTTRLMPPDQTSPGAAAMLAAAGGLGGVAEGALGLKTTGGLFIGILQSQTVEDNLIEKFGLQKVYHVSFLEDARKVLAAHTDISEDSKSGIITVRVTDHRPERAAAIAQEYENGLNWVVSHLTTSSAHRERVFLEERLAQVKEDLEAAEKDFSQFASANTAIDIKEQGRAMLSAAATLQGQLIAAESELEGLRQIYADNNVRVRALEARVGELKHQFDKLGGKGPGETRDESFYPSIRRLPLLGVSYSDLYRKVTVQEAVFETLTRQYELAKVQEAKEIPTVKVLDSALIPGKKSFPPRLLVMTLGTFLSVAAGMTWVFCHAAWKATDRTDPRRVLAAEVWSDVRGALPWYSKNGSGLEGLVGSLRAKTPWPGNSRSCESGQEKQK